MCIYAFALIYNFSNIFFCGPINSRGRGGVKGVLDGKTCSHLNTFSSANTNMCKFLLDMELPTSSYTKSGESTIDQIIENLPTHLARRALDQFIFEKRSGITAKISIYLSCLGKKRWRLLSKQKTHNELAARLPPDPLQVRLSAKRGGIVVV